MVIVSLIIVFIHSALSFFLSYRFLENMRVARIFTFVFAVFNATLSPLFLQMLGESQVLAYLVFLVLFTIEIGILFKSTLLANLAISVIIMFHFYSLRAITISASAIALEYSLQELIRDETLLWHSSLLTLIIHIVVLLLCIVVFKPKYIKAILSNELLLKFIFITIFVVTLFSVYNSSMFLYENYSETLITYQIVITVIFMIIFYMFLLFMLKLVMTDKYQDIIKELEKKLDDSNLLFESFFGFSDVVIEYNATNDYVKRAMINSVEMRIDENLNLEDFYKANFEPLTCEEDRPMLDKIDSHYITNSFNHMLRELTFDYRSKKIHFDNGEIVTYAADDESPYLWYQMSINSFLDPETNDIVSVIALDEITNEKEKEFALLSRAERDVLTGAYNKNSVATRVNSHLAEKETGTLFIIDLDNFKSINDEIGHSFGDKVLVEIYEEIKNIFRDDDILGRFGGDEFVTFILNEIPENSIIRIANRICKAMQKTYNSNTGDIVEISSSVGIATATKNGRTYEELFEAADKALYLSKNKGKNTFTIYDRSDEAVK